MPGIFISEGMTVSIPAGALKIAIGPDGHLVGLPLTPHVRFDVCPNWIRLAEQHLQAAGLAKRERELAWAGLDEGVKGRTLESEFDASMQAIVSAATAIDAMYSVMRSHIQIPEAVAAAWKKNRTARHAQVLEVFRRGCRVDNATTSRMKQHLGEIYRFRDAAVHPSGRIEEPIVHPELNVGVEPRFVMFREAHARLLVGAAKATIRTVIEKIDEKNSDLRNYGEALHKRIGALVGVTR